MVLDSISVQNFHYLTVVCVKMPWFVELIPGKGPGQALDDTTLTSKAQYSINFFKIKYKILFKSAL